jgi:hypothetical protein
MSGCIFHFALMSFCLQRQLQQIFRVPKDCDLFSLIRMIIMRLSCCKCNSCRVLYYLLFFTTPATSSCLVYYVEFSCMRSITRSDGWLFGENVCRERERRRRRFSQQSERTVPPGNKNEGNSSSSPSFAAAVRLLSQQLRKRRRETEHQKRRKTSHG